MRLNRFYRYLYSPFLAQLVIIRRCNLDCAYCNERDDTSGPVPVAVIRERLDRLRELGAPAVTLTGGEPTLHPDLPDLIRYARRIGFFHVSLISNGFLMGRKTILALNAAGLDEIQISVDGVTGNGTTRKTLANLARPLARLRDLGRFNVTVSAVIGACPAGEVRTIISYAKGLGFTPRILLMHDAAGQFIPPVEPAREYEPLLRLIPKTMRDFSGYRMKLLKEGAAPYKCRGGSRYLYVDEKGRVAMCSQTRAHWSRPLEEYGLPDLRERFHAAKPCQVRCTLGCVRSCSQFENWRQQESR